MIRRKVKARHGLTLIELLIVIAVIGLLVSIAIPVVLGTNERSRQVVCKNNLRQYGTAILAFASANGGRFPSGMTLKVTSPLSPSCRVNIHNYMTDLLPYLENHPDALSFDYSESSFSKQNQKAISTPISAAICPSAPSRDNPRSEEFSFARGIPIAAHQNKTVSGIISAIDSKCATQFLGGLTDYAAIAWVDKAVVGDYGLKPVTNWGIGAEGMFPYPVPRDYRSLLSEIAQSVLANKDLDFSYSRSDRDLADGAQYTLMMTECAGRPQRWEGKTRTMREEPVPGSVWADPFNLMRVNGAGGNNRCLFLCDNRDAPFSFHSDVFGSLFADGHIEFLSVSLDGGVFISLVSVRDEENRLP